MRKEGKTPETYRHGVFPTLGICIRGIPDFGEGELDRSKKDSRTQSKIQYAGVYPLGQRYLTKIIVPGLLQRDSDENRYYLGIYDTALQAAQVRHKVKTVLEQRGDLTPAGVFPEHGIDIRGLKDFKPESLLVSTDDRHRSKYHSKYKYVHIQKRGRGAYVKIKIEDKWSNMGTYRTELEAAQVVRKILYLTRNETWRTETETRQIKWY